MLRSASPGKHPPRRLSKGRPSPGSGRPTRKTASAIRFAHPGLPPRHAQNRRASGTRAIPGLKPASRSARTLDGDTKTSSHPRWRLRAGSCDRGFLNGFALGRAVHVLDARLANVDAALEVGAVFDADALADDVAGKRAFIADVDTVAAGDVALHLAQDHDFLGVDIGLHRSVAADGYPVAGKVDGAFHPAVDVERLRAGDFALDHQRLADGGLLLVVENGVARRRCGRR